jgi:hypothetical protein
MCDSQQAHLCELIGIMRETDQTIKNQLSQLAEVVQNAAECGFSPPLTPREAKVVRSLLYACSLYQPKAAIRRQSWGTIAPSEMLKALDLALAKLDQLADSKKKN